jgi:hypothetical protein
MPGEAIQRKLLEAAPRDIEELLPQLEPRAEELAALAIASHSSNVTSNLETANGFATVTSCGGPSLASRSGSFSGEPIMNLPAGMTIIAGQPFAHSLKSEPGFAALSPLRPRGRSGQAPYQCPVRHSPVDIATWEAAYRWVLYPSIGRVPSGLLRPGPLCMPVRELVSWTTGHYACTRVRSLILLRFHVYRGPSPLARAAAGVPSRPMNRDWVGSCTVVT